MRKVSGGDNSLAVDNVPAGVGVGEESRRTLENKEQREQSPERHCQRQTWSEQRDKASVALPFQAGGRTGAIRNNHV